MTRIRLILTSLAMALGLVCSSIATETLVGEVGSASAALTNCTISYSVSGGQATGSCNGSTANPPYTTQGAFFVECRQPRPYSGRQWATSGWLNKYEIGKVDCRAFGTGWYPIAGSGYWVFR